ncbi:uncharacterized protein TNCV_4600711 [Trichonephila clavipes]|nr:uncharacterized protein TNCV_4600711 [Trichonephila clavipes]
MGHPPYLPDLAARDFFLFPTIKSFFKGTHFTSVEEVNRQNGESPEGPSKTLFQNCYQQWQHRMQKCVNAELNYFEGDNVTEN